MRVAVAQSCGQVVQNEELNFPESHSRPVLPSPVQSCPVLPPSPRYRADLHFPRAGSPFFFFTCSQVLIIASSSERGFCKGSLSSPVCLVK